MRLEQDLMHADLSDFAAGMQTDASEFCIRSGFGANQDDMFHPASSAGLEIRLQAKQGGYNSSL